MTEKGNRTIEIRTIAVDFTDGQSIYFKLRKELAGLSVGTLVNNVGMKLPNCCVADMSSGEEFRDIINCNIMSVARLTNLVLPSMRKKKRGLIINIGSVAGTGFAPMRAAYGATKVYYTRKKSTTFSATNRFVIGSTYFFASGFCG